MGIDFKLFGITVKSSEERAIKVSQEGDLYIAQNLPPYTLATAAGRGWQAQATSAAAATTTIPTTTVLCTLYNGETGGGKSLVIDSLFANTEAWDAGNYNMFFFWICVHPEQTTPQTADITIKGLRGGDTNYGGKARFDVGATVVNDTWYSRANSERTATGNVSGMANIYHPVEGKIVIPPTCAFSIHVGTNDSNITVKAGISWYEVQLDLA